MGGHAHAPAAGTLGRPGMVMMSPVRATRNPAPADTLILRTVMVKPPGRPEGWRYREKGVLGLGHADGQEPKPSSVSSRRLLLGGGVEHPPSP